MVGLCAWSLNITPRQLITHVGQFTLSFPRLVRAVLRFSTNVEELR